MFTNKYLPKSDNYYQRNYIVENNYNLPKEEIPVAKDSLGILYFPNLDNSNSTSPKKNSSGSDITDLITNDKLKFLGATAEHLKSQIDQRAKIRDDHVNDLDSMIMDCDTGVMNLESWPMFSNQMVEKKRADFKNVIQKLESEKKQEVLKCWKDQSSLYKELLETLGEYKNVQRRSKMLSGGY